MMRKLYLGILAFVVILFISWFMGWWIPNRPDYDKYPVWGIDVSHHNGEIDWSKVKRSGIQFAYIKATEGSEREDIRFPNNWTESKKNQIYRGAYHFFSTTSSGEAQALNYISAVPKEKGMMPPAIDLEFARSSSRMSDQKFYEELEVLKNALEQHYGVEPVIYTTEEFRDNYFKDRDIENLWAREIKSRARKWAPNWMFWQYSNRGRVSGVRGRVGLNVYRRRLDDLKRLLVR